MKYIYISDQGNERIRKVDIASGIISTIAGTGITGYAGDGLPATAAEFDNPNGLCFDEKGNLYIADYGNNRIRKVDNSGIITTFAGTGIAGYNGDGGLADTSMIRGAFEICSDDTGNIYIADEANGRIRKVDTFNIIHTIAGNGTAGFSGDSGGALFAEVEPHFITYDKFGNIYFSDLYTNRIRKISSAGIINTVAGNGLLGYFGDGGLATAAEFHDPFGVITDSCGNLYICDGNNYRIRKVTFDTSCRPNNVSLYTEQLKKNTQVFVFPNPAYSAITITATERISAITITNLVGKAALSKECSDKQEEIDLASLSAGVYVIKVKDNEGKVTVSKVIKE